MYVVNWKSQPGYINGT